MTADLETETPVAERICARCRWSRNEAGELFQQDNRAFCSHPSVVSADGRPVPCELQRFAKSSDLLQQCGEQAIYFEPRQ